ncbi:MAG: cohesin domain-containing protein [Candidatus Jordarchaeaceae archaeon]
MLMKSLGIVGGIVLLMLASSAYSALIYKPASGSSDVFPNVETTLYFEPERITVTPGESFTVKVKIENLQEDLWGFEVGLRFDKTVLEYIGVEYPAWQFVSGKIGWLFWVATLSPQSEDQTLLTLTFQAKGSGETELAFYSHKLATAEYVERISSSVGWPIEHVTSIAVVISES